jgi:hypothetical protein
VQLGREDVRPEERDLVGEGHARVEGRTRLDAEGPTLGEERGNRVLLGLGDAAAEVPGPVLVLLVGRARGAFALLAAAARPLGRVRRGEELGQGGVGGGRRDRHRVLGHPPWLRSGLPSRCKCAVRPVNNES